MSRTDTTIIGGNEFVIEPYKRPLVQLRGAVKGYMRGTLPYAVEDGRLPCAWCGQSFDVLSQHLRRVHNMSAQEYRDRVGLLRKTRLVSEPYRSRVLASITPEKRERMARLGAGDHGQSQIDRERKRRESLAAGYNAERLNKRGTCRDQILAVAKEAAASKGGVLRESDLIRQGISGPARRRWFPSMHALAEAIGARSMSRDWSDHEMLQAFRRLAERLGRTPTQRDLGGYNGTPSNSTYQARFGGLEEVCRRTRLPSNLPPPITFGDEIDILNRYAICGNVKDVARATHRWQPAVSQVLAKYGVAPTVAEPGHTQAVKWAATIARRLAGAAQEDVA